MTRVGAIFEDVSVAEIIIIFFFMLNYSIKDYYLSVFQKLRHSNTCNKVTVATVFHWLFCRDWFDHDFETGKCDPLDLVMVDRISTQHSDTEYVIVDTDCIHIGLPHLIFRNNTGNRYY